MTFEEVLDQAIAMLQRRGRVTYRTLQLQFELDEERLEALKDELLYAHPQVRDEAGRGLVWAADLDTTPPVTAVPASPPARAPLAYTPPYLAEKILTSRTALEGERKQVTVLFADLKGSMELLAERDPEEARQLLDPVLERMMEAVHRYEGTVNQVMGDGIMALFGAPIAHEDHAIRACYAALRMQDTVRQYATEMQRTQGVPLHIRVGLNAGEVVVRAIGSDLHMDYTAVGQTTHLAARMEQMAMPGSTLITSAVLALAEGFIQVKPLGPVPVKGLAAPVAVYEVVDVGPVRTRLQAAVARGLTRFVGRDPELDTLHQALARAGAGHGQVVALVGEAGVGKSRLAYEFLHDHRTQGWLILASSSVSYLTLLLIARTEGNPFFLEESVRTLVETGLLVGAPGAYRLAQPLDTLHVPATVQAVLAARIDRLPAEEKRLLQTAAVIGTEVPLPVLQAIAELSEAALHHGLAHLQSAEFLYETRLFPDHAYTFKHALTHEVAYGSLLQERRRGLHARIVEALEGLAPDRLTEQVEILAHHALWGEVWDKTLAYCRQAGDKAMARSAYREAMGSFEQALSALPHVPETRDTRAQAIDLRLALRAALHPLGDFGRVLAILRQAEALASALDDAPRLVRVLSSLANYFRIMGAPDQAITAAQRAIALAVASGDVSLQALGNQNLGLVYLDQGDYPRVIDYLRQAVVSVAPLDGVRRRERFSLPVLPDVIACAHLAECHAELGLFAEGRALGAEGLQMAEAVGHLGSLMYASRGLGLLSLRQGDLPRALPLLERAVGMCQEADLQLFFLSAAAALGTAYTLAGRLADAVPLPTQALEWATAMDMVVGQVLCCLSLGETQMLAGRLEEAHVLSERALAHQQRGRQAYALRLLGDIAARREPPDVVQAAAHYQQALALAEELGMRPLVAHCHRGLGTLYATTGQRQQAHTALSAAVALYRNMEMTFWLPQVEAALAQVERR